MSLALVGLDDRVWTAYNVVDTYFDQGFPTESAKHCNQTWKGIQRNKKLQVPISGQPNPDPREYFLDTLYTGTERVRLEYENVLSIFEEILQNRYESADTIHPVCLYVLTSSVVLTGKDAFQRTGNSKILPSRATKSWSTYREFFFPYRSYWVLGVSFLT